MVEVLYIVLLKKVAKGSQMSLVYKVYTCFTGD